VVKNKTIETKEQIDSLVKIIESPDVNVEFCQDIILMLRQNILSEDPAEYVLIDSKNLDLFSWEKVEKAKEFNAKIHTIIQKIRDKINSLKATF